MVLLDNSGHEELSHPSLTSCETRKFVCFLHFEKNDVKKSVGGVEGARCFSSLGKSYRSISLD